MVTSGNATVFVSNMDRAISFYSDVLGLKLTNRFGDHWANVAAPSGFTIGLHPASPKYPAPGAKGGIVIGLDIDEPVEQAVARLRSRGVAFTGDIIRDANAGNFANLTDPDGNEIYLWESPPVTADDAGGLAVSQAR